MQQPGRTGGTAAPRRAPHHPCDNPTCTARPSTGTILGWTQRRSSSTSCQKAWECTPRCASNTCRQEQRCRAQPVWWGRCEASTPGRQDPAALAAVGPRPGAVHAAAAPGAASQGPVHPSLPNLDCHKRASHFAQVDHRMRPLAKLNQAAIWLGHKLRARRGGRQGGRRGHSGAAGAAPPAWRQDRRQAGRDQAGSAASTAGQAAPFSNTTHASVQACRLISKRSLGPTCRSAEEMRRLSVGRPNGCTACTVGPLEPAACPGWLRRPLRRPADAAGKLWAAPCSTESTSSSDRPERIAAAPSCRCAKALRRARPGTISGGRGPWRCHTPLLPDELALCGVRRSSSSPSSTAVALLLLRRHRRCQAAPQAATDRRAGLLSAAAATAALAASSASSSSTSLPLPLLPPAAALAALAGVAEAAVELCCNCLAQLTKAGMSLATHGGRLSTKDGSRVASVSLQLEWRVGETCSMWAGGLPSTGSGQVLRHGWENPGCVHASWLSACRPQLPLGCLGHAGRPERPSIPLTSAGWCVQTERGTTAPGCAPARPSPGGTCGSA